MILIKYRFQFAMSVRFNLTFVLSMTTQLNNPDVCKLQVSCRLYPYYSNLHNELVNYSSIFWLTSTISFFGLFNNAIALWIFYRLKWYKKPQTLFFINGTIVDFIECLSNFVVNIYYAISLLWPMKYGIISQLKCVAVTVFIKIPSTCLGRFCFVIAFDRLFAQWYPAKWYKMGKLYHWIWVFSVWIWSAIQEAGWLFVVKQDQCVVACLGYSSYPTAPGWNYFSMVGDFSMDIGTIVIYFFIPIVTSFTLKPCINSTIVRNNNLFFCRQILSRVRLISLIMIPCYLCTIVIGAFLSDFSNDCVFDVARSFIYPAIGNFFLNFSSVIVPYVYLADAEFRIELITIFSHIVIYFKKLLLLENGNI